MAISESVLPRVTMGSGRIVDLAELKPESLRQMTDGGFSVSFRDPLSGTQFSWSATLTNGANAVIQSLTISACRDIHVDEIVFLDDILPGAIQVGSVDGSVVVCGDIFMAVEHPLAKNTVDGDGRVCCRLPRGNVLKTGHSWSFTSVFGVVPPGQLRRGFLFYLEQRRAHPYRQFLHYNNWYDVFLGRPMEARSTESDALAAIAYFGRELVEKRGVKFDAFVWDDGWDDFNSLWDFHRGFPDGFKLLDCAARQIGAAQGVWLSPWGGYASAKDKRIAYGRTQGLETNASGFAMAGSNYGPVFRDVCLRMMREQGVVFFKFDGMGAGNVVAGAEAEMASDIDAILDLTGDLRREDPDVFISATTGTWASPYWLLYADSIWRQGGDTGSHGQGNSRQQWMTYRDMFTYERVVQAGPLYPLNSLMLHGILIGNRPGRAPAGLGLDEKSVADEIWSFFGSGTSLQELYISPGVPTEAMLDELAAAAKWARQNDDVLIDTHWVGGNPGNGEIYGWASWRPGKGIVVLRNPADRPQSFTLSLQTSFELPLAWSGPINIKPIYPRSQEPGAGELTVERPVEFELAPFQVIVMEIGMRGETTE